MNKSLLFLLSAILSLSAQTSINVSGSVTSQNSEPLQADIIVNQLVGGTWEYRTEGASNTNGEFSLTLDNITSVAGAGLSSLSYSLHANSLYAPVKTAAEIIDYNLLGEEVSRQKIELQSGSNVIKFELASMANGIYIRSIVLKEGVITQKIVKQGTSLSYGTAGIDRINISAPKSSRLNKVSADSLYIMTIAEKEGFYSDTLITSIVKDNPSDITGLLHSLQLNDNYIYAEMLYVSSLGDKRINESVELSIEGVLDTTIYSDTEGILKVELNLPANSPREAVLTFPDYEDRLKARIIHKKGTKLDQEPVAVTDYVRDPANQILEVYNTMQVNLDSLEKAYEQADLALFDFNRFYETNEYINNGVFDLNIIEHITIFKDAINITWTAEYTDSLWFITSDINQHTGEIADPNRLAQLDTTLKDMVKMLTLEGTGIEEFNRVKIAGIFKVDDIVHNEIIDYLRETHDLFNYAQVYFTNFNGNSQGTDNLRIKNAGIKYTSRPNDANVTSELLAGILKGRDPPNSGLTVGDYFHAISYQGGNKPTYNNTVFTEAAWGCAILKFMLPQGYPIGR